MFLRQQMTPDWLAKLQSIDLAMLTELVSQDQRSPDFVILNWAVEPLGKKGFGGAEALFLFHGQGRLGEGDRPWSLVLKILKQPTEEQPLSDYFYWKRELLAARAEWVTDLPPPVRAQRIYRAVEEAGFAWLWMEHVQEAILHPWTLHDYAFAARQLGIWHGTFLAGAPQPFEPWLCRDHIRGWLRGHSAEHGWDNAEISASFSREARTRHQALWADLERFLSALNHIPQVFSHYDFQRRNLFICKTENHADEIVAIDWALCGSGALGGDMHHLIIISAIFFDFEAQHIRDLDTTAFAAYLDGLRSAGWIGDMNLARLGYCIWAAAFNATIIPTVAAYFTSEDGQLAALQSFGVSGAELLNKWSLMLDYCLDCADEARLLIKKLGVA
jgi:hypothetical protein